MSDALAAAQTSLARQQRLSALGGLAAAAAHELGSPLATIAVVAKELSREVPPGSAFAEDIDLLLTQSDRCREILAGLSRAPEASGPEPFNRVPLSQLVDAVAEPEIPGDPLDAAGVPRVALTDEGQLCPEALLHQEPQRPDRLGLALRRLDPAHQGELPGAGRGGRLPGGGRGLFFQAWEPVVDDAALRRAE